MNIRNSKIVADTISRPIGDRLLKILIERVDEMADKLRDSVHKLVLKKARAAGFVKPMLEVSDAAKNGESYSGNVYRVIVTDGKASAQADSPHLRFIVKLPPIQEHRRLAFSSARHFAREQFILGQVMPALAQFQAQVAPTTAAFNCFPKMLAASSIPNDEYVLVEDLQALGYATAERSQPLGFDRVALVLWRLAQFHAVSFALKEQKPAVFADLTAPLQEIMFVRPCSQAMIDVMQPNVQFVLNAIADAEHIAESAKVQLLRDLDEFRNDYVGMMVRCSEAAQLAPSESVILHGDCWISNLMFSEDAENVQFLDWQVARHGSVAIDLSYFLFCCTDKQLRQRLPELLLIYYDALVQRIGELGSDGEAILPYERFQWHMRRYARFGCGMAAMTLHATVCPAEEMVNVAEELDRGDRADRRSIGARLAENPVYKRRIADVFHDAHELGYLQKMGVDLDVANI